MGSLERRVAEVEVTESKVDQLESRIKGFQNILTGLENSEKALDARIDTLNERINRLLKEETPVKAETPVDSPAEKEEAPVKAETPVDTPAEKEASPPETQKGFHIVRSGETLYRIATMYGVSVADLRRLNNLSEMQFIFPGQKLRVPRDTP